MGILAPNEWGRRAQTPDPWAINRIGAGMSVQNPTGDDQPRARVGRPPSCLCGECRKCKRRISARERYQSLTTEQRRELIARRDQEKVRAADRARYYRDWDKRRAQNDQWFAANPDRARLAKEQWAERNPEKRSAQFKLSNAVRDGKVTRGVCEVCGSENVHGHHDDYSKPLDVRWLCPRHHSQHHAQMRAQGQSDG